MHSSTNHPHPGSKLIELSDVSMRHGEREVLSGVNLTVNLGDFWAITGPNGGGKTTLLKIILKLLRPTTGKVTYTANGHTVDRLAIGYLPQKNMIDSHFPIDVRQVVASGLLAIKGLSREQTDERIDKTLELVGLTDRAHQSIGQLSGGQLQRALLGRALISEPEVVVLDEPLSYVDIAFEHRIYDIIASIAPDHTILLVSHEMSTIAEMANRHLIVDGTIHECHSAHHFARLTCDEG